MNAILDNPQTSLRALLATSPYGSYAYSYPHKTAYRPLPSIPLSEAWANEPRDALFLYLHIPFCEMRCGFCNLFTMVPSVHSGRDGDLEAAYLGALERQAERVRDAIRPDGFARMAVGGGTPTILGVAGLHRLFDCAESFGAVPGDIPVSVETSPATATPERLRALRERGGDRISIGVQSFVEAEVHAVGRVQKTSAVRAALEQMRAAGFPTLNIDLMYGLPGQSVASWLDSLRAALEFAPEEIYLYPLYVRPLTGVGRRAGELEAQGPSDVRPECYRAAREFLQAHGYEQVSMRMFRARTAPAESGPVYCCQEDGMIGLGCGARSYTRALHYSTEYAVAAPGVRGIVSDYLTRPEESFAVANYGFQLDDDEQRRRYLIQSLLHADGLDFAAYMARFGTDARHDMPQLDELETCGLAARDDDGLRLNASGLERSDTIGPWLGSAQVRARMETFALR